LYYWAGDSIRLPAVSSPSAPAPPDFRSEYRPAFPRRLVDDSAASVVRATPVRQGGLNVFPQRLSAGVELPRPATHAQAGGAKAQPCITSLAKPAQIGRGVIPLVPVTVVYHQGAN
jgi:hypothetical protein